MCVDRERRERRRRRREGEEVGEEEEQRRGGQGSREKERIMWQNINNTRLWFFQWSCMDVRVGL